jgi:hypothetical protein
MRIYFFISIVASMIKMKRDLAGTNRLTNNLFSSSGYMFIQICFLINFRVRDLVIRTHWKKNEPITFKKWFDKENANDKLLMKIINFQLQKDYEEANSDYY